MVDALSEVVYMYHFQTFLVYQGIVSMPLVWDLISLYSQLPRADNDEMIRLDVHFMWYIYTRSLDSSSSKHQDNIHAESYENNSWIEKRLRKCVKDFKIFTFTQYVVLQYS